MTGGSVRSSSILGSGWRVSLFQTAASFTLLETMKIWCNIQVSINPLLVQNCVKINIRKWRHTTLGPICFRYDTQANHTPINYILYLDASGYALQEHLRYRGGEVDHPLIFNLSFKKNKLQIRGDFFYGRFLMGRWRNPPLPINSYKPYLEL